MERFVVIYFQAYSENHGYGILPFDFKMAVIETSEAK